MMNLRDSHILNHKQNLEWNWLLIATILKVSPTSTELRRLSRLLLPSQPMFNRCSSLPVAKRKPQEQQR